MPIYQSFPGIRAFSGILFALLSGEAAPGRISGWSGKVHQADFGAFERVPQEKAAGADEAQHVVRGHEAVGARGVFPAQQTQLAQAVLHGHSGGLGRIHDAHVIAYHMAQGFAEQGEVRAAQHQGVGPVGPSRGEQVAQIAAGDALDDGAVHPAFLGQGHEKGAGPALDAGLGAQGGDGLLVGAAGDGGFGGDDHDTLVAAGGHGGLGTGAHDPEDGQGREVFAQFRQGGGGGGIAGHHQHLDAFVHQASCSLERVADDGVAAFGAVGQAGRITKVEQVLAGQAAGDGFEHGQAAHAGIKDADGQGS